MDGDVIALVFKAFGPAGGLAILILAASLLANYKLFIRLNKQHDTVAELEKDHAVELAECRADCQTEKLAYRDILEKRYHEAVQTFLDRDNQKRIDVDKMFDRFENLVGIVSDGLTKVTQANQELRYSLKGK